MIASGSIDGRAYCTSLVATAFTQSVEPGNGTNSTLMPASLNHPILVAIANGAAADDTVLAHQATRTVVCACAGPASTASAIADNRMAVRFIRLSLQVASFFAASSLNFCDASQNSTRRRTAMTIQLSDSPISD